MVAEDLERVLGEAVGEVEEGFVEGGFVGWVGGVGGGCGGGGGGVEVVVVLGLGLGWVGGRDFGDCFVVGVEVGEGVGGWEGGEGGPGFGAGGGGGRGGWWGWGRGGEAGASGEDCGEVGCGGGLLLLLGWVLRGWRG